MRIKKNNKKKLGSNILILVCINEAKREKKKGDRKVKGGVRVGEEGMETKAENGRQGKGGG